MYFRNAFTALVGLTSLAASAPLERGVTPLEMGLRHKTRAQKRTPLIIEQTVVEPSITVVEENLDTINQLALTAEQEFAALVQSQLALVQEVQTIMNNIRVNTFKARFSQVNTVIVCVTQVVDVRNPGAQNNRYLVNQLLADNGKPESEVVVMLTAAAPMTIGLATPTLPANLAALLPGGAAAVKSASTPSAAPAVGSFDANAPFGLLNQSVILPYGSSAPTLPNAAQVFADPAAIVLPGQTGLFVEDIGAFGADCALWTANSLSLFDLGTVVVAAQQVAEAELAGLVLGSNPNAAAAALLLSSQGTTITTTTTTSSSSTTASTSTSASSVSSSSSSATAAGSVAAAVNGAAAQPSAAASAGGAGVQVVAVPAA